MRNWNPRAKLKSSAACENLNPAKNYVNEVGLNSSCSQIQMGALANLSFAPLWWILRSVTQLSNNQILTDRYWNNKFLFTFETRVTWTRLVLNLPCSQRWLWVYYRNPLACTPWLLRLQTCHYNKSFSAGGQTQGFTCAGQELYPLGCSLSPVVAYFTFIQYLAFQMTNYRRDMITRNMDWVSSAIRT